MQDDLFTCGPPLSLWRKPGGGRPARFQDARHALLFVLLTWVPMFALSAWHGLLYDGGAHGSFLSDFGALARYCMVGPLLLVAESVSGGVMSRVAQRFAEMSAVTEASRRQFDHALRSTERLRDKRTAEVLIALLAYGLSAVALQLPLDDLPKWHRGGAAHATLSPAGWWCALVSLPLLLMLMLGWIWRLALWTRFLWLMSRLELQLVAVHPDRSAGVGFAGYSVRGFCLVGAAIGALVAGPIANKVVHSGASLADHRYAIAIGVVVAVVLLTAPLLTLSPRLLRTWRDGVHDYGRLAHEFGQEFERAWLRRKSPPGRDVLQAGDFSAATDLYQVVDRVHDLRLLPVDLVSVAALAGATLLPFVPIVLITLPFDTIVTTLLGFLR